MKRLNSSRSQIFQYAIFNHLNWMKNSAYKDIVNLVLIWPVLIYQVTLLSRSSSVLRVYCEFYINVLQIWPRMPTYIKSEQNERFRWQTFLCRSKVRLPVTNCCHKSQNPKLGCIIIKTRPWYRCFQILINLSV